MRYTFFFSPPTSQTTKVFSNSHPFVIALTTSLNTSKPVSTMASYNELIHSLVEIAKKHKFPTMTNTIHKCEIEAVAKNSPLSEKVIWGGVTLKKVDVARDFIQKLLVVNKHGILGFEIHEKKLEKLKVLEGICLVIYANHKSPSYAQGQIRIQLAMPGDTFVFQPFDEHGIIALSDCVIEETSTNHLDDLVYIYPSKQMIH